MMDDLNRIQDEIAREIAKTYPAKVIKARPAPEGCKIALVGEAPGSQEEIEGEPFVGQSGKELSRMLEQAGINRSACFLTNVFSTRPPGNNLEFFTCNKAQLPSDYSLPAISTGRYVRPEYLHELHRLKEELLSVKPNIVIALGNPALWALSRQTPKIGAMRGTIFESSLIPNLKCISTYHPANILREWSNRVIAVVDLQKAFREAGFPEIRRKFREVIIEPTLEDLHAFSTELNSSPLISFDVETKPSREQLLCISLAPSETLSLVLPFVDRRKPDWSYWDLEGEVQVTLWLKHHMESPIPKLAQNGLYDIQWLYYSGIRVRNAIYDTMLYEHALYPGLPKGLDFLASIHSDEIAWKLLRPRGSKTTKREE